MPRSSAALRELGDLPVEPKQAWTNVADFTLAGSRPSTSAPARPATRTRTDEQVDVAALERAYLVLRDLVG